MKSKSKKIIMLAALFGFIVVSFALIEGCKKSEPSTSSTMEMSGHDMSNMANHEDMASDATMTAADNGQTICPVMGEPINQSIFVEHQGKKVYFCCDDCKAKFLADPEKYIVKLPQFTK